MNSVQLASVIVAFLAALLWFISAIWRLPAAFPTHTGPVVGMYGAKPKLTEFGEALKWQSRFSAGAAAATGVATVLQALGSVQSS